MRQFVFDVKRFYKYIIYSTKSELKSEIANSHLSWLWWILDPLLFMLVYSFISVIVFGKSEQYFPVFVFIGLSCWSFFEKTLKNSVKLVSKNSAIVSKVYIPKYLLIFVRMGVNGFKMGVSFILVFILMFLYKVPITVNLLWSIPTVITLMIVTFGFSGILLHFGVFVEDLSNVINVLLKLVFYLSGVFYSIAKIEKKLPFPYKEILLKCNPIAFIINELRNVMIYSSESNCKILFLWLVIGIIISCIGIRIIYKYENSYVKVI